MDIKISQINDFRYYVYPFDPGGFVHIRRLIEKVTGSRKRIAFRINTIFLMQRIN